LKERVISDDQKQDVSASYHDKKPKRNIMGTEKVFNPFHPSIRTKI